MCGTIGETLELLGPHLLQGTALSGGDIHSSLINAAMQILAGEHECQKSSDEAEEVRHCVAVVHGEWYGCEVNETV